MIITSHTSDNTRYCASVNTEFQRNVTVIAGCGASLDVSNILVGKLAVEEGHDSSLNRVGMVSESINPLKVRHDVVHLDCIDVIDLGKIARVWDERSSYQSVDGGVLTKCSGAQIDTGIPSGIGPWLHVPAVSLEENTPLSSAHSIQATDVTGITDFVKFSEAFDSYWPPLFNESADHPSNPPSLMMDSSNMAIAAIQYE